MKIYAIIRQSGKSEPTCTVVNPKLPFGLFSQSIAKEVINQIKHHDDAFVQQIVKFMQDNSYYILQQNNFVINIKKTKEGYCAIATDHPFSKEQATWAFNELEKSTQSNLKLEEISQKLNETKKINLDNIDKMILRQEKLEELMVKADELKFTSYAFGEQAKKLNSCCWLF